MDHENMVKAYSASPSMLGRGHSLFEPQGPVWVCNPLYLIEKIGNLFYSRPFMHRIFILN
jgi:hypothetical protein